MSPETNEKHTLEADVSHVMTTTSVSCIDRPEVVQGASLKLTDGCSRARVDHRLRVLLEEGQHPLDVCQRRNRLGGVPLAVRSRGPDDSAEPG